MKLFKKMLFTLVLSLIIYMLFTVNINKSYATGYISLEEAETKMPGISNLVNTLKTNHPNYNFQFYDTGLDWETTILREYQGHGHSPTNLFNFGTKFTGMWYCPVCGTTAYDNGTLSCASKDAIRYMMDPRNSINEDSVFQFKSLEIADASYDDIARACIGTFLNNGECVAAILEASQAYNINPFYLVAKILTEQGTNGSTLSNGVAVNGAIYYNLFNIGAFGNKTEIIANGANYAASQGWNSRRASIIGGAQTVKDNYIGKGQNTCYYQKYNVVNVQSGLYSHQYAQNILAAENEGRKFKSYYNINGTIIGNHTFIIPLYNGMPQTAVARPKTAVQNSIVYETGTIIANGGVKVRCGEGTTSEQIGSIAQNVTVKILYRGQREVSGYFWDLVISDATGIYGFVARNYIATTGSGSNAGAYTTIEYSTDNMIPTPVTPTTDTTTNTPAVTTNTEEVKMKISGDSLVISSNMTLDEIKTVYPYIVIIDETGAVTARLGTGSIVNINGGSYKLVKKGDVNGDGEVNVSDIIAMLNHIKQTNIILDASKLEAASLSGNGIVTVTDVVKELNYIKRTISDILVK